MGEHIAKHEGEIQKFDQKGEEGDTKITLKLILNNEYVDQIQRTHYGAR
jgi:hypothetical protein